MNIARDRPFHRFLDGLADVSRSSFWIVLGVGATLLALPVILGLAFWLIMWPLSGLINIGAMIRQGTTDAGPTGDQFWAYWGQVLVFLVVYGSVAWPLRALFVERADSPPRSPNDESTSHAHDVGRVLTFSWRTFSFVVAAIAVGNLAASAVRGVLPTILGLLEAALVTVVIPTSRAAVALALITTALERWANWWVKQRQAEVVH
jgi:uncharacterized protein involved in cysteine biosynthesis